MVGISGRGGKSRKLKAPSAGERLTAVENSVIAAMNAFRKFEGMLETKSVENLVLRVDQLEKLFKPEMEALLGELRAVRNLLDTKKEYSFMDKPRPPLTGAPVPEGVIAPSIAQGGGN